jgi:serine protease inhibitor
MGVSKSFDATLADFSGISNSNKLYISEVVFRLV